ncbi:MAG: exodeoxyribonuclease VII small subunit [Planctomycetota bacterium]|nr:MAG: exodeoxyribonuclease VII small subunit [Planctomycetota bacterium]
MPKKQTASPSFEERFAALEAILTELESGELSLEDSLRRYEEGVKTLRACREVLRQAEQRMEELTPADEEGSEG